MARVGSIVSPLVSMTAELYPSVPLFIYGAVPVAASAVTVLLPETLGQPLPDTVQDLESRWAPTQKGAGIYPRSPMQGEVALRLKPRLPLLAQSSVYLCPQLPELLLESFLGIPAPGSSRYLGQRAAGQAQLGGEPTGAPISWPWPGGYVPRVPFF